MRLVLASLLLAGCASEPSGDVDYEFDEQGYADEDTMGCGGGKCDGTGEWATDRLDHGEPLPPTIAGGWDAEMVDRWNNEDQGVMFIPYSWVLALERADSEEPFLTTDSVARWGILGGRRGSWNPDGLPVGVAV